jgi:hypothetical protein
MPEAAMPDNRGSHFVLGIVLGGLVLLALVLFVVTGGNLGGKQKIAGDDDLPQVTSPAPRPGNNAAGNVGAR